MPVKTRRSTYSQRQSRHQQDSKPKQQTTYQNAVQTEESSPAARPQLLLSRSQAANNKKRVNAAVSSTQQAAVTANKKKKTLTGSNVSERAYNLRSTVRKQTTATISPSTAVARRLAPFETPTISSSHRVTPAAATPTPGVVDIYDSQQPCLPTITHPSCNCPVHSSWEQGNDVAFAHIAQYGKSFGEIMRTREKDEHERLLQLLPSFKSSESDNNDKGNSGASSDCDNDEDALSSSTCSKHTPLPDTAVSFQSFSLRVPRSKSRANEHVYKSPLLPVTAQTTLPRQPYLTFQMRSMLVNWLAEVCQQYKISDDAFHLTITLIDRVLLTGPTKEEFEEWENGDQFEDESEDWFLVPRSSFQALGCACTLIAAKLEDRSTPKMEDLCYISDHSFTEDRIRELEETICKHLSFRLSSVTPLHFVNEFLRASHACPNRSCQFDHLVLRNVVLYLLALTRLSYELTMAKPSLLAAAAVYLARVTVGLQEPDPVKRCTEDNAYWTKTLHYYTGYHVDDLKPVVLILHRYQTVAEKAENVKGVFSAFKISARRHASLKTAPSIESLGFPNVLCSHDEMVESLSDEMF